MVISSTQVGKTFAIACWILAAHWSDVHARRHASWWVAPTYNQVQQGYRLVVALGQSAGILDPERPPITSPYPQVWLRGGGQPIEFRSWEREQGLMGTTAARIAVDEAGLLTPEAQSAISSRRSGTLGPARYIGNPGHHGGPFRRLCNMAADAAHPDSEWRGTFSLHRWTWHDKHAAMLATNPARAEEYRRFIEQERSSLPEFEFRRLYEAEWTEDEACVFRGLRDPDGPMQDGPQPGQRYTFGVDVAQEVDYLAAVALNGSNRAVYMDRWRGIPYPLSAVRLADLSKRWNDALLVIEDNGPGLALVQILQQRGVPVLPFTTTGPTKQEIIVRLASELARTDEGRLRLADLPPLHDELRSFRYERMPGGNYRYSAPAGEHDDTVMALALGLWGTSRHVGSLAEYGWI